MDTGDWIFYYEMRAVEWLNPIVYLVGLAIAVLAFRRCGKRGYLVIAAYFMLSAFTLLAVPSINRAIRARLAPDYDAQTRQKINAASQEAVQKVLAEAGRPQGVPAKLTFHFPLGPIILVAGLWLLARREPQNPAEPVTAAGNTSNDHQPPAESPEPSAGDTMNAAARSAPQVGGGSGRGRQADSVFYEGGDGFRRPAGAV